LIFIGKIKVKRNEIKIKFIRILVRNEIKIKFIRILVRNEIKIKFIRILNNEKSSQIIIEFITFL